MKTVWLKSVAGIDNQTMRVVKHRKFIMYSIDHFLVGHNQECQNKAYKRRLKRQIFGKVNTNILNRVIYQ